MLRLLLGATVILATLGTVACGEDDSASGAFDLVAADIARAQPEPGAASGAANAGAILGFDILAELEDDGGNRAISPYSIQVALAMTRNGAAGTTREEMASVLHSESVDDYDASMNALDQLLLGRAGEYPVGDGETVTLELSTANALWGQRGVQFEDEFLRGLAEWYGAGMRLVDYDFATEEAREAINGWVAEQTRDRISELIPQGAVSPATVLVLTNAVYLNAPWAYPFEEADTADATFTRLDGSTVEVPMMHQVQQFRYSDADDYAAVELPYAGSGLGMLLVVPDEGKFEEVERSLDAAAILGLAETLTEYQVTLDLPRFEFRSQLMLNDVLSALGMPTAFGAGADFSGMTGAAELYISAVLHETFISVDEEGTEAAAATAVIMDETAAPERAELRIDRPFIFLIRDLESGGVIFVGRVTDPSDS